MAGRGGAWRAPGPKNATRDSNVGKNSTPSPPRIPRPGPVRDYHGWGWGVIVGEMGVIDGGMGGGNCR